MVFILTLLQLSLFRLIFSLKSNSLIACQTQTQGVCTQCIPGFYLASYPNLASLDTIPSFCVPDCNIIPMLRNNDVQGICQMCQASSPDSICIQCNPQGTCLNEVTIFSTASFTCPVYQTSMTSNGVNKCQLTCDPGYTPVFNAILGFSCHACSVQDPKCQECLSDTCTRCSELYYLNNGQCVQIELDQGTDKPTLFVTSNKELVDQDTIFTHLENALIKADSLGSPYKLIQMTIYLTSSIYIIPLAANSKISPSNQAFGSAQYSLTIMPMYCSLDYELMDLYSEFDFYEDCVEDGLQSTLYLRNFFFSFKVPNKLALENILITAVDNFSSCVTTLSPLCKVNSRSQVESLDADQNCACDLESRKLSTSECDMHLPTSLFKFELQSTYLQIPKILSLTDCQFQDFHFHYNSIIQVPSGVQAYAQIIITSTIFKRFTMCGAALSNEYIPPYLQNTPLQTNINTLQSIKAHLRHTGTVASQITFCKSDEWSASAIARFQISPPCMFILITASHFEQFDYFTTIAQDNGVDVYSKILAYEDTQLNISTQLKRRGMALDLQGYAGVIVITDSQFSHNSPRQGKYPNIVDLQSAKEVVTNNNLVHSKQYGIRVDSVISIAECTGSILLMSNIFEKNVGTKGPLYVSSMTNQDTPVVFLISNDFTSNSGIYGSATMYVRIVANEGQCGNTLIEGNTLTQNSIFQRPGSIMKIQCFIPLDNVSQAAFDFIDEYQPGSTQYEDPNTYAITRNYAEMLRIFFKFLFLSKASIYSYFQEQILIKQLTCDSNFRFNEMPVLEVERVPYLQMHNIDLRNNGDMRMARYLFMVNDVLQEISSLTGLTEYTSQFLTQFQTSLNQINSQVTSTLLLNQIAYAQVNSVITSSNWNIDELIHACGAEISLINIQGKATLQDVSISEKTVLNSEIASNLLQMLNFDLEGVDSSATQQCPLIDIQRPGANATFYFKMLNVDNVIYDLPSGNSDFNGILFHPRASSLLPNERFNVQLQELTITKCTLSDSSQYSSLLLVNSHYYNYTVDNFELNDTSLSGVRMMRAIGDELVNNTLSALNFNNLTLFRSTLFQLGNTNQEGTGSTLTLSHSQFNIIDSDSQLPVLMNFQASNITLNVLNTVLSGFYFNTESSLTTGESNTCIIQVVSKHNTINLNTVNFLAQGLASQFLRLREESNSVFLIDVVIQGPSTSSTGAANHNFSFPQSVIVSISKNNIYVNSSHFRFIQNTADDGAIYYLHDTALNQTDNQYFINTAKRTGGVYFLSGNSNLTAYSPNYGNNRAQYGGVFYLSGTSSIYINGAEGLGNSAGQSGGVLFATQSSQFHLDDCDFEYNFSTGEGSVIFAIAKEIENVQSTIVDCHFQRNTSQDWVFALYFINLYITESRFYQNKKGLKSPGIEAVSCTLLITHSKFFNDLTVDAPPIGQLPTVSKDTELGFFHISRSTELNVTHSYLAFMETNIGALLFGTTYSKAYFHSCYIYNNEGTSSGALVFGLYLEYFGMKNCSLSKNLGGGQLIFLQQINLQVEIQDNTFNTIPSNGLLYNFQGGLKFRNNIVNSLAPATQPLLSCILCETLTVWGNEFVDIQASTVIDVQYFESSNTMVNISQNAFQNVNASAHGGGISLINVTNTVINANSFKYINNTGEDSKGGAIYVRETPDANITISDNVIEDCEADEGGAIMWEVSMPKFSGNTYANNKGRKYADDVGTVPYVVSFIDTSVASELMQGRSLQTVQTNAQTQVSSFRSSDSLAPLYLAVLDIYGQIVKTFSGHLFLNIISEDSQYTNVVAQPFYSPLNGVFNITDVVVFNQPGSSATLQILSDDASLAVQNSLASISLQFRGCEAGQSFTEVGGCSPCVEGTYLLELANQPSSCLACPVNAVCYGGSQMGPLPGYWRPSNTSTSIYECYLSSACLGSFSPDSSQGYQATGSCYSGHSGRLCGECDSGYIRNAAFQCSECPPLWQNLLLFIFFVLLVSVGFVFIFRATLASATKEKSLFTVFFKILINHIQLLSLLASFNLRWPSQVQTFFDMTKPVADIAANNFSFSCLLQISGFRSFSYFYLKLILLISAPLLLIGLILGILTLKYRRNVKAARLRTTAGVLLLLFFIHPSITSITFQTFLCKDIESVKWLVADLAEECWTGLHLLFAVIAGLGAAVWSFGIPVGTWAILAEEKPRLQNREVRLKYGFLYKGFKPSAYYWESFIMLRKVAIIFVASLLSTWGEIIQAYILIFLLFFFGLATARISPYLSRTLNYLEMFSLFSALVSVYLGLFFLTSTSSQQSQTLQSDFQLNVYTLAEWVEWSAFCLILLSNIAFLVLWVWFCFSHLSHQIRQKYPRLYVACFLCCRKQVMEEEMKRKHSEKKNESYIKEVQSIREKLGALQNKLLKNKEFVTKGNIQTHLSNIRREIAKIDLNAMPSKEANLMGRTRSVQDSFQQLGELSVELESELNVTTYDGEIEFKEIESRGEEYTRPPTLGQNDLMTQSKSLRPGFTKRLSLDLQTLDFQEKEDSCNALEMSDLELDHNIEYEYKKTLERVTEQESKEPEIELKRLRSEKQLPEVSERSHKYGEKNEIEIQNIIASLCESQESERPEQQQEEVL